MDDRAPQPRPRPGRIVLALAAGLLASGCAGPRRSLPSGDAAGWLRAEGVPVVRQASRQGCGAAALAMVLAHAGRPVPQASLWAASPPGRGRGLRAATLRDLARAEGLRAYLLEGRLADLERELARGRPVLVGVVQRRLWKAYPHYEVVVGLDRARRRIRTHDPARGPRERALRDFQRDWTAAGRVTLVVLPPAQVSAAPAPASSSLSTERWQRASSSQ